jgi:hypothetical protein
MALLVNVLIIVVYARSPNRLSSSAGSARNRSLIRMLNLTVLNHSSLCTVEYDSRARTEVGSLVFLEGENTSKQYAARNSPELLFDDIVTWPTLTSIVRCSRSTSFYSISATMCTHGII